MTNDVTELYKEAVSLLSALIALPSFSKEEEQTAGCIHAFFQAKNIEAKRVGNNILVMNQSFNPDKPTILLNSHHDTVRPSTGYTKNPFEAIIKDDKLFGLGSNDAGGCLVSLLMAFLHFYEQKDLKYNLVFAATAEEEVSGTGGIQLALEELPPVDCAIVGEPTLLQLAVAERGLIVLDAVAPGKAGHAARNEGDNAIYRALQDISWIQAQRFEKVSPFLGEVKLSVTSIETENKAHNIVPATCRFIVDVRVNELYFPEEIVQFLQHNLQSTVQARSTRLRSTSIPLTHPLVKAGTALGKKAYGSPTTSDKALMPFPALKVGPGDSARSHTADEFIYLSEIRGGIEFYIALLQQIL